MMTTTIDSPVSSSFGRLVAAAGCAGLALAAHAGGDPAAAQRVGRSEARAAAAAWTPAPAKHNGSGIRLAYRVPAGLQPGQPGTVQLQFSGAGSDDARAEWRVGNGVAALAPAALSVALPRGEVTTVSVVVTPSADGTAFLDVFTSQAGRTSAQSVPLKVGSGAVALKRDGAAQTMPSGEKVISLPSSPK